VTTKTIESHNYSLREKKYARTKVALARAFVERMNTCRFDDISVKEICAKVEVSEGTFFNYFPEKIDVVTYYLQLNDTWVIWKALQDHPQRSGLQMIAAAFDNLADKIQSLNIALEFITVSLRMAQKPKLQEISPLEKYYAYGECPGMEAIVPQRLPDFLESCLHRAVDARELSAKIDVDDALVALKSILIGTLCAARFNKSNKTVKYHYRRQLAVLWRGLGQKE